MEYPRKESLTVEFKSDLRVYPLNKLYEDLVGLANTDGGVLFLGMEDNGSPTGVDVQHKNCQDCSQLFDRLHFVLLFSDDDFCVLLFQNIISIWTFHVNENVCCFCIMRFLIECGRHFFRIANRSGL